MTSEPPEHLRKKRREPKKANPKSPYKKGNLRPRPKDAKRHTNGIYDVAEECHQKGWEPDNKYIAQRTGFSERDIAPRKRMMYGVAKRGKGKDESAIRARLVEDLNLLLNAVEHLVPINEQKLEPLRSAIQRINDLVKKPDFTPIQLPRWNGDGELEADLLA